jgi:hypothetical protein
VLTGPNTFFALYTKRPVLSDGLFSGLVPIKFAEREADEEEYAEGELLVDSTRLREDHPCVGLLQIDALQLCGDGSPDDFIQRVLGSCARFVPKIVNERPDVARSLCPHLHLHYFSFLPFLALCPAEFGARFMHGVDAGETKTVLVSTVGIVLRKTYRSDSMILVDHVFSSANPSEQIRGLFRSVCKREGSAESLSDVCALVSQLEPRGVKPATGGMKPQIQENVFA